MARVKPCWPGCFALLALLCLGCWWVRPGDPLTPCPRPGTFSAARLAAAQARRPAVLFLGDSLTSRWEKTGRRPWSRHFAHAACLGVGEDKTEHLLWRLRARQFPGFRPAAVVVLIGTNNVPRDRPDDIAAAVASIASECHARWPTCRVIVVGVLPRGDRRSSLFNRWIARVNSRLARDLNGPGTTFLDLTGRFGDPADSSQGAVGRPGRDFSGGRSRRVALAEKR